MCDERASGAWWGRGYGPWMRPGPWMMYGPWTRHSMRGGFGFGRCPCCGREIKPLSKAEKIERLEAFKKRMEEKLSKIDEKIEKLKKEKEE